MTYRKWGRSVRYENGTVVRVEEAGEAVEEGGEFRAYPHPPSGHLLPLAREKEAGAALSAAAASLSGLAGEGGRRPGEGLAIERIVLTEGIAIHETNGITWTERTRRLHLSIVRAPFRMLIDQAHFDVDAALLDAFARLGRRREPPPRLRLAPRVSAAILHSLPIDLAQRAGEHPDGKGQPIDCRPVQGEPPNWYRPSYRVRPLRAWFNLMALPFGKLDDAAPRAVARLDDGDVLCVDGGDVFATALPPGRILAVGGAEEWFPFGAGAWGADMLMECGRPRPHPTGVSPGGDAIGRDGRSVRAGRPHSEVESPL
jgi:hypothetical protein